MKRFNLVWLILLTFTLPIFIVAQPPERDRMGEPMSPQKLAEFKKLKLLEVLDLDEKTSEKFLAKYNATEKVIQEQHKNVEDAILDLEYMIRKKVGKDELAKQSQKVMDAQKNLVNALMEQQKEIKTVLNEEQFAKFLVFENRFRKELQRFIIDRAKGKRKGRDRDIER